MIHKHKRGEALTLGTIVTAVIVLVVLGILLYMAYKYIWGTGSDIGELSKCEARAPGAQCKNSCNDNEDRFFMIGGCGKDNKGTYCCIPKTGG